MLSVPLFQQADIKRSVRVSRIGTFAAFVFARFPGWLWLPLIEYLGFKLTCCMFVYHQRQ